MQVKLEDGEARSQLPRTFDAPSAISTIFHNFKENTPSYPSLLSSMPVKVEYRKQPATIGRYTRDAGDANHFEFCVIEPTFTTRLHKYTSPTVTAITVGFSWTFTTPVPYRATSM
jgi:hypothetical protein